MRAGRHRRPKIAELLGQPAGAVARRQIASARSLQVAPTLFLEIRLPRATYLFEDPKHPDRRTGEIQSSPYTHEDRALLMGLESYEASLCRCGVPIAIAWHSEMDGYYESTPAVCHACSAMRGQQVVYATNVHSSREEATNGPMPVFVPGVTITAPDKGP